MTRNTVRILGFPVALIDFASCVHAEMSTWDSQTFSVKMRILDEKGE
ncbi:MAG: hypothetical protein HQM10_15505 [Candidatus Riflebacteria bacterium]|nr:hypothetical protein [Candidatus Riflebacteria bacterium]